MLSKQSVLNARGNVGIYYGGLLWYYFNTHEFCYMLEINMKHSLKVHIIYIYII